MVIKNKSAKILELANKLLIPKKAVAGLQVTNSDLRFLEFTLDRGNILIKRSATLRLPPGIIEHGRVKDKPNFIAALKNLRGSISKTESENVNVVLTIPTGDVYAQAFNIPKVAKSGLEEAVNLNLQVISPIPIDRTYYSWKVVGEGGNGGPGQIELLGVFVEKNIIEDYTDCLEASGFGIAAIEFSSLSMARLLSYYKVIDNKSSYLLIKMTQEGLIFMILKNGNLYFDYFHSWDKFTGEGKGVTIDSINDIIYSEGQRIMNFYASHWGGNIKNIVLITPALVEEMSEFIKKTYPALSLYALSSDKENLHGVRGAALRGATQSPLEADINLMNPARFSAFYEDQIIIFTGFWRNVVITIMAFLLIAYGLTDIFLRNRATEARGMAVGGETPGASELAALENKASQFNSLLANVETFKVPDPNLYEHFSQINSVLDSGIELGRLRLQGGVSEAIVDGIGRDQETVIAFKNRLTALQNVQDVQLPLNNIQPQPDGRVSFSISFKLRPS